MLFANLHPFVVLLPVIEAAGSNDMRPCATTVCRAEEEGERGINVNLPHMQSAIAKLFMLHDAFHSCLFLETAWQ
jgi:hypothetical protein